MPDALRFDLRVAFPEFTLEAADTIPPGGITVLSGPSGSGKSTLLRALAGLEPRASGAVTLGEADWTRLPPAARRVGYVFQDARLFPHLDVAGNLDYGARRRGTSAERRAAVIEALDLAPLLHRNPATLSGGEARRVALGRALASDPRVLLMDEPLAGLDRARKADLMPYIARAVAGFGGPALYVTHSAYESGVLADRVLHIAAGRLTGRSGGAPRLAVTVKRAGDGWIGLELGGQLVWVPGRAEVGTRLALPLGEGCLVSTQAPGQSTGAVTLQATLAGIDAHLMELDVAGQRLSLPVGALDATDCTTGQAVWLTLPRFAGPLLTPSDSD